MESERMTDADPGLSRRDVLRVLGLVVGASALPARPTSAGPVTRDQFGDQIQTTSRGELPEFVRPEDREIYRFAREQGADLQYIPCFCGCTNIGHRHNRDCYIKSENRDGTVTWTSHGAT